VQFSTKYIITFSFALCIVCSLMISVASVSLRERQEINKALDKKTSVLQACWLTEPGQKLSAAEVDEKFSAINSVVIDLATGADFATGEDAENFDEDIVAMVTAPDNASRIQQLPTQVKLYHVMENDKLKMMVLPISGYGLWGTLHGFLALDADLTTIRGITYYSHKETPGLGAEVDNPKWKTLWPGRMAFDESGEIKIEVIKGVAGTFAEDPHHVDGLSGATITSRWVTNMLHFWLGEQGYAPYFQQLRASGGA
jgi:Na+-transporting NADH:ubiquinone oxidoreductase subunit C